jgi:hypothetical protein
MARRVLFSATSPLGYRVSLGRDRWREIVRYKHPALAGREKEIQRCIEAPEVIRASAKDRDIHLYYVTSGQVRLCAVVAPETESEYFLVTAYFTKNIKQGKELWKS